MTCVYQNIHHLVLTPVFGKKIGNAPYISVYLIYEQCMFTLKKRVQFFVQYLYLSMI